jgi:hypothetical protein
VTARISSPSLGAASYQSAGTWTVAMSHRWQYSDRHFVGDSEQRQREREGSQVINDINLIDLSVSYAVTKRINATLSAPFQFATRSSTVRSNDVARTILRRYETQAYGLGDIKLLGTVWLLDPDRNHKQNVSVGLGVKFPTGEKDSKDTFQVFDRKSKQVLAEERNVDNSIQPGDGAWGIIFDLYAFRQIITNLTAFVSGTYIAEPEETTGVASGSLTPPIAASSIWSVADSYLFRAGFGYTFLPKYGLTFTLGGRMEGTPSEDIFGGSGGRRRPGFAVSIEPGLEFTKNRWFVSFSAPVALYRNREISVLDEESGDHGDAAFADFMTLFTVGRAF